MNNVVRRLARQGTGKFADDLHRFGQGESNWSKGQRRRRWNLFQKQDGLCWWCRERMSMIALYQSETGVWKHHGLFASFEHLIPKSMGGTRKNNIVLAHASCNGKREKRRWPHDPIYGQQKHGTGQRTIVSPTDRLTPPSDASGLVSDIEG